MRQRKCSSCGQRYEGRYCPNCAPQGFNKQRKEEEVCESCGCKVDFQGRCGCSR